MLKYFDIKSALAGGVLSLVVGGGLYGLYMKTLAPAAFSEASAYELLSKCVYLNTSKAMIPARKKEVESFLRAIEEKSPEIGKADAVTTVVVVTAGQRNFPSGMGAPLHM